MNIYKENLKKTLRTALSFNGLLFEEKSNDEYSITRIKDKDQILKAKLMCSAPIDPALHGSKNNTEIKAIGFFNFEFSNLDEFDCFILSFFNPSDKNAEFVVIQSLELKGRLDSIKHNVAANNKELELKLWLLPDNLLFETTNFGAEAEWWFVGGRMAKNTKWDYTTFHNGWNLLWIKY